MSKRLATTVERRHRGARWQRLQKRLSIGRVRATLGLDEFNTLNTASTLRQFGEATATTFRSPLEIVAPRLIRLGLQLQF